MAFFQQQGHSLSAQFFPAKGSSPATQRSLIGEYYSSCGLDLDKIEIPETDPAADVHVVTGWQTFKKGTKRFKRGDRVVFFCQDLEYLFPAVRRGGEAFTRTIRKFYDLPIPTFTMSRYLEHKCQRPGKLVASTNLNVETDVYFDQGVERKGVCLFYRKDMPHRLPDVVNKLADNLHKRLPGVPVYTFGSESKRPSGFNSLGSLTTAELAALYNRCELGVCFSKTNPSRVPFEMVACGLPCVEADNEFTSCDLVDEAFVRLPTDNTAALAEQLVQVYNSVSTSRSVWADRCAAYARSHFAELAEEKAFLSFVLSQV